MITMNEIGEINQTITAQVNILAHNRTEVTATAPSELRSVHTTLALRCRYIDHISAASHRSITAFLVKMNLTFMKHSSSVTSHQGVMWQCNAIAVQYERTFKGTSY